MEEKLIELICSAKHLLLLGGLVSILAMLRKIPVVADWLFGSENKVDKKWLIGPLNLLLSLVGVFAGLTDFESASMKVAVAVIVSAMATYSWEALIKRILRLTLTQK